MGQPKKTSKTKKVATLSATIKKTNKTVGNTTDKKVAKKAAKKTVVNKKITAKKAVKQTKQTTSSAKPKLKRGRPKGSKNKKTKSFLVAEISSEPKLKRGRPKGSKNKKTREKEVVEAKKKKVVEKINEEILSSSDDYTDTKKNKGSVRDMLEQILFRIPDVKTPLIGTPKEVQKKLDNMAKSLQKNSNNMDMFNTIHLYMHGYLINMVLKKFPFIVGYQTVDIYQETLIALRFKAIPNFKKNKGMSFLNFAKMCIRRHLITLLHASKNRNKDKTINLAISLDSSPIHNGEENNMTYANIISDGSEIHNKVVERNEAFEVTKKTLMDNLSDFERVVLEEYLASSSYREISKDVSGALSKRCNTKSIDNALLRIRKKAIYLVENGKVEDIPLFI